MPAKRRFESGGGAGRNPRRSLTKVQSDRIGGGAEPRLADNCRLEHDPTPRGDGLKQRLSELLGEHERVDPRRIVLGGSGRDWIARLATALHAPTIIRVQGDVDGCDRSPALQGLDRVTIPVDPLTFALTPEAVAQAVRGRPAAMLRLTFPVSAPLQARTSLAHVEAAVEANPDVVILADGAYRHYGDHRELAVLADRFPQVIYLQSASTDLCLPEARLSWIVPSARHAARIAEAAAPSPPDTAAMRQASALLQRPDTLDALRREQRRARDYLAGTLPRLGLPTVAGPGPWVLLKWPEAAGPMARNLDYQFDIQIEQQHLPPLDETWVRISATGFEEAELTVGALTLLLEERRPI